MLCPCGSTIEYNKCCETIILGKLQAESPEQLMRSRYSAYALKISEYIYNTYAKSSKMKQSLKDIDDWAQETQWLKLEVTETSEYQNKVKPTVTFEAIYKSDDTFYKMKEKSSFIKEETHWRYIDGTGISFDELELPKRNDKCLCGSGKKYKKCCGK